MFVHLYDGHPMFARGIPQDHRIEQPANAIERQLLVGSERLSYLVEVFESLSTQHPAGNALDFQCRGVVDFQ